MKKKMSRPPFPARDRSFGSSPSTAQAENFSPEWVDTVNHLWYDGTTI